METSLRELKVEIVPVSTLEPWPGNARKHSKKQIGQIAESMRQFGWTSPVLVDAAGRIIAGHGRLEAAKLLGLGKVPVIRIEDLSEAQVRACRLADNRLAEKSAWDDAALRIELKELIDMAPDFEITLTGFEMGEIDLVIGDAEPRSDSEAEVDETDATGPRISRTGDMWLLGKHRLLCANALEAESYGELLDGEMARLGLSDPPYNVRIEGNVSGLGRRKHGEFGMASGEMSSSEFTRFLQTSFSHMASHSVDGAIHFIFMDWRHAGEIIAAGNAAFDDLKNVCVWDKKKGGMGSLYRSAHEFVFVFKSGTAPHINNVALGSFGRNRTNVWRCAGANSFGAGRDQALDMHPTVKPVGLVADAILDCSNRGDLVLDPFCGSGSTIVAAERTGRRAAAIELDPAYVDTTLRRWRRISGVEPVHAASGRTLGGLEADPDFVFERALA